MLNIFRQLLGKQARNKVQTPSDAIRLHQDYKDVFGSDKGERVLADICRRNFVFDPAHGATPHESAHSEGRRHLALSILRFVEKPITEIDQQQNETTP